MSSLERYSKTPILLVDNSPQFTKAAANHLRDSGLKSVHVAHDGLEAIKLVQELSPHVVLLDVEMPPGISGLEVLQRLHALGLAPKVILMTGHNSGTVGMRGAQLGITDFIPKSEFYDVVDLKLREAIEFGHSIKHSHNTMLSLFHTNLDILERMLADQQTSQALLEKIVEIRKASTTARPDKNKLLSFLHEVAVATSGDMAAHVIIKVITEIINAIQP